MILEKKHSGLSQLKKSFRKRKNRKFIMVKARKKQKIKQYCETLDKLLLEPGQVTDLAIRSTSP